jgi:hypothetical protein
MEAIHRTGFVLSAKTRHDLQILQYFHFLAKSPYFQMSGGQHLRVVIIGAGEFYNFTKDLPLMKLKRDNQAPNRAGPKTSKYYSFSFRGVC